MNESPLWRVRKMACMTQRKLEEGRNMSVRDMPTNEKLGWWVLSKNSVWKVYAGF